MVKVITCIYNYITTKIHYDQTLFSNTRAPPSMRRKMQLHTFNILLKTPQAKNSGGG